MTNEQRLAELWNKQIPKRQAKRVYVEPCKYYPDRITYIPRFWFSWVKPEALRLLLVRLFEKPVQLYGFWSMASVVGEMADPKQAGCSTYRVPVIGHWEDVEELTKHILRAWQ